MGFGTGTIARGGFGPPFHRHHRTETVMGRTTDNPRYNVISLRLSDKERAWLDTLMEEEGRSASEILRGAFLSLMAVYRAG